MPRTGWASDWSRLYRACAVGAIRHAAPASSDAVTGSVASSAVLCPASRAAAPPAAGAGPATDPEELGLGRGQRRIPARIGRPDARGHPGRGELDPPVEARGILAILPPPSRVLGELAVEDQAGLILLQPAAQSRPGLEQRVVRDFRRTVTQHRAASGGTKP